MNIIKKEQMAFVDFDIFCRQPMIGVVSCRTGGVSENSFSSLNMKYLPGESDCCVQENRYRFLSLFDIPLESVVACEQVHASRVVCVTKEDCGKGAMTGDTAIPNCDGLCTNVSNVPLVMFFADCTPLLFYDPVVKAVGIAHGGWRGTVRNIASVMVESFKNHFGSRAEDIRVGIGPTIGFDDFEVGRDVLDAFSNLFTTEEMHELVKKNKMGKYFFHLPKANRFLLERSGIKFSNIEDCHISTYSRTDLFYSYRKEKGKTGRHMAVMMLC